VSSAPKKSSPAKRAADGPSSNPTPASQTPASASAGLPVNRYLVYFVLAVAGCAIDLYSKAAIFRWRGLPREKNEWWIVDQHFGVETSLNPGALFGMGAGGWWLFALFSVVALVGIVVWLFVFGAARDRWITVALGFVSGGIVGNLYDRLGLPGFTGRDNHCVRDWILFKWPESGLKIFDPWPNFNIADSLLVTGAIMLALHAVIWRDKGESPADDKKTA
jgi:signal peptidase II